MFFLISMIGSIKCWLLLFHEAGNYLDTDLYSLMIEFASELCQIILNLSLEMIELFLAKFVCSYFYIILEVVELKMKIIFLN